MDLDEMFKMDTIETPTRKSIDFEHLCPGKEPQEGIYLGLLLRSILCDLKRDHTWYVTDLDYGRFSVVDNHDHIAGYRGQLNHYALFLTFSALFIKVYFT